MTSKIVLFGATGYTGRLTAQAMADRGLAPLLAGRNESALKTLSQQVGGLTYALADVARPETLSALLNSGDVLVSTVGPFSRVGQPALDAAIDKGAHYIDSTGEISFAHRLVNESDSRARNANVSLHTTCGYDFVPGHCAAAVALRKAGENATRIDIGYFDSADTPLKLSQGTIASMAEVMLAPGYFWEGGKLIEQHAGLRLERFSMDGKKRPAMSISSTEHLFLPRHFPQLKDVNVYLGWFGALSNLSPLLSRLMTPVLGIAPVVPLLRQALAKLTASDGKGPSAEELRELGSHIVAIAYDAQGHELSRADLKGVHGYLFTANILARFAQLTLEGQIEARGAIDGITALGIDGLVEACQNAGLSLC